MKKSRQLLSIVIVFFWASEYCHVPYFTPYLNMLGFSVTAIGIMVGTYGFTQMIVRIPLGIFTDVSGKYKAVVVMGTVFTTVSSFGLIFAESMWFVMFCRFLAGIAASTWISFTVLYSAYYQAEEGVQAMANISAFNNGGKLLAFVLGTITANFWGYRVPLIMSFLTGLVAIAFAVGLKTIPIRREPMQISHIVGVFKNPADYYGISDCKTERSRRRQQPDILTECFSVSNLRTLSECTDRTRSRCPAQCNFFNHTG